MKLNLKIEGMACEHCVKSVKKALEEIDEIKVLEVEVKDESILTKIREKLDDVGYDLI